MSNRMCLAFSVTILAIVLAIVLWSRSKENKVDPMTKAHETCSRQWHTYPSGHGSQGFYVSDHELNNENISRLKRTPENIKSWQGIVLVSPNIGQTQETEFCLVFSEYIMFGDPLLIEQIKQVLSR